MRKFLFISSGILFIAISIALIIIAVSEGDEFLIIMSSVAVPFLFIGYWNLYSIIYEGRKNYPNEYFTIKSAANASAGVFYHKDISMPIFLILFMTAGLAIVSAFLALNKATEDIAIGLPLLSFMVSLLITIKYQIKLSRGIV